MRKRKDFYEEKDLKLLNSVVKKKFKNIFKFKCCSKMNSYLKILILMSVKIKNFEIFNERYFLTYPSGSFQKVLKKWSIL